MTRVYEKHEVSIDLLLWDGLGVRCTIYSATGWGGFLRQLTQPSTPTVRCTSQVPGKVTVLLEKLAPGAIVT